MVNRLVIASLVGLLALPASADAQSCSSDSIAIQILGSGGPRSNANRASSSYLVWVDGRARILVDIGGGSFLRFGQAQAKLSDLSLVAISHLHPDHVSDLPALLWLSNFSRQAPLPIVGPSGNDIMPDFPVFLSRLFDAGTGAFQVLGTALTGTPPAGAGGSTRLDVSTADVRDVNSRTVFDKDGMKVTAIGIPHGNVPTLAYRVEVRGAAIVFSSDQNGTDPRFLEFARGADLLVMHMEIGPGVVMPLHASPATVGRVASQANVKRLIVSHIGQFDLDSAIDELRSNYSGPLSVGADLQCTTVR